MTVHSEVPILVRNLQIHTIVELRRRALSGHVPVSFCDGSVTVQIDELVLERSAGRIIFLLVEIVGIWCISDHLSAEVSAGSFGDRAGLYVVVIVFGRIEFREDGILECAVESCLYAQ